MVHHTDVSVVTIERFIIEQEKRHAPEATGELSGILYDLALAAKMIASKVRSAGLADVLGATSDINVHGETQQKLDVLANSIMIKAIDHGGRLCAMASEEEPDIIPIPDGFRTGKYCLLFDPLDGSSNIDVNVPVGTIFSVLKKVTRGPRGELPDMLQRGRRQVAAGYVIYGSSTMLVYTTGQGVHGFTLDPSIGEFLLSHPNIRTPRRGRYLSVNDSYARDWDEPLRALMRVYRGQDGDRKPLSVRYVGSLVADFHRNLLGGGSSRIPRTTRTAAASCGCSTKQSAGVDCRAGGWRGHRWGGSGARRDAHRAAPAHPAVHWERRGRRAGARRCWRRSSPVSVRERPHPSSGPTASAPDATRGVTAGDRESPSGIPIAAVYRPADWAMSYATELADPGQFPFTRGIQPTMYRGRLVDDAAIRRVSGPRQRPTRASSCSSAAGQTGPLRRVRSANADGHRLRLAAGGRRGRAGRCGDRQRRRHAHAAARHPARPRVDVDDDQRHGRHVARDVPRRGRRAAGAVGRSVSGTIQNDILKEYVARGTYVYPPAASLALVADMFRFCADQVPELESDFDLRLPHPRGRRDGRAGAGVHFRERHGIREAGDRRGARRSSASRPASRFSSPPTTICSRKSPSFARRAGSMRASCATDSAATTRVAGCGSTRRPAA